MGYSIYLLRKEVKAHKNPSEYLEINGMDAVFTDEQFKYLKGRMLKYDFQIEHEESNSLSFNFKGGLFGISALLSKSGLFFSSGFTEDGIFEIGITAAEFTDTGEFASFDPQTGEWGIET